MTQKPLGLKSRIADSILRYAILHREYDNSVDLYNAWVRDVALYEGYHIDTHDLIVFALEQADACVRSTLEELRICAEIEDSMRH